MNTFETALKELNINSVILLMYIQLKEWDLITRLYDSEEFVERTAELEHKGYLGWNDDNGHYEIKRPLQFDWGCSAC